jgi:hypothetical protein
VRGAAFGLRALARITWPQGRAILFCTDLRIRFLPFAIDGPDHSSQRMPLTCASQSPWVMCG